MRSLPRPRPGAGARRAAPARRAPVRAAAAADRVLGPDGRALAGPSLEVVLPSGLKLPNPFVIGSGPPGTNHAVMRRAFRAGWGAVVAKTVSLDASLVRNVVPRYAKLRSRPGGDLVGWENIELISDRPLAAMLDDFKRLKDEFPDRVLIASIMEEPVPDAWGDLVARCRAAGVDAFEINAGCPHGMPERRMGSALGQDADLVRDVVGWVVAAAGGPPSGGGVPVWLKLTPNVTDVRAPAAAALAGGAAGLALINTVQCIAGVDLATLRPLPTVEGRTTPGGYSGPAVKPIALAKVAAVAPLAAAAGADVSGMGGIDTGEDAAEFVALGSHCVQVCTGVMTGGYDCVHGLAAGLQRVLAAHSLGGVADLVGAALPHVTLHSALVAAQADAKAAKAGRAAAAAAAGGAVARDDEWDGDAFQAQSEALVSNKD